MTVFYFGLTADEWNSGNIGKQCRIGQSKYKITEIQTYREVAIRSLY